MQIGVYGSGYLGTVISACLADFGTPVTCCHPDRSRMVEMAQGNVPFHEKNLKEIIRRNVRAGRLAYSTDIESFARKMQVIFLAEDNADNLTDVVKRIARLAPKPPILTIVTPVAVGTAAALEKTLKDAGMQATIVSQPMFFTDGCAVEDFNWPDRLILGSTSSANIFSKRANFSASDLDRLVWNLFLYVRAIVSKIEKSGELPGSVIVCRNALFFTELRDFLCRMS